MRFGSQDGGEGGKHTGVGFVEISDSLRKFTNVNPIIGKTHALVFEPQEMILLGIAEQILDLTPQPYFDQYLAISQWTLIQFSTTF